MALPAIATIVDLEKRLGGPITETAERERAVALLADASAIVRHEAGATWVDAEGDLSTVPDLAVAVACAVALRAFHNPADVESTQLGAVSVRYRSVWLTAAEADRLSKITRQAAGSVDLEHGYGFDGTTTGWVPVDYGGDWFPLFPP